ncbi:hypothetical protein Tco_0832153 [Tanacetum coccineum]
MSPLRSHLGRELLLDVVLGVICVRGHNGVGILNRGGMGPREGEAHDCFILNLGSTGGGRWGAFHGGGPFKEEDKPRGEGGYWQRGGSRGYNSGRRDGWGGTHYIYFHGDNCAWASGGDYLQPGLDRVSCWMEGVGGWGDVDPTNTTCVQGDYPSSGWNDDVESNSWIITGHGAKCDGRSLKNTCLAEGSRVRIEAAGKGILGPMGLGMWVSASSVVINNDCGMTMWAMVRGVIGRYCGFCVWGGSIRGSPSGIGSEVVAPRRTSTEAWGGTNGSGGIDGMCLWTKREREGVCTAGVAVRWGGVMCLLLSVGERSLSARGLLLGLARDLCGLSVLGFYELDVLSLEVAILVGK